MLHIECVACGKIYNNLKIWISKIIDKDEKAKWYLGKISLWDYLESLNLNSFEYDIQRGNKEYKLHVPEYRS